MNMDLDINLKNSKFFYEKEDGTYQLLKIESVEEAENEAGDIVVMIYFKEKRSAE